MVREIEAVVDPFGRCNAANAARVLQVSTSTLANWRSQGLGPKHIKVGGTVFYLYDDLTAFATGEAPSKAA